MMKGLIEESLLLFINLCILTLLVIKINMLFNAPEMINVLDNFVSCFHINVKFLHPYSYRDVKIVYGYILFSDKLIGNVTLIIRDKI